MKLFHALPKTPPNQVPCRFYARGACRKGETCTFTHQSNVIQPISTSSCPPKRRRKKKSPLPQTGPFLDQTAQHKTPIEKIPVYEAPEICSCPTHDFKYQNSKQKKKIMNVTIASLSLALGHSILPIIPDIDSQPKTKRWILKNSATGVLFIIIPSTDGFILQGDPNHSFCILSWLECLQLEHTCFVVSLKKDKKRNFLYFRYTAPPKRKNHSAAPETLPLLHRIAELQHESKKLPTKEKTPIQPIDPPSGSVLPQLDVEEKKLVLQYARELSYSSRTTKKRSHPSVMDSPSDSDSEGDCVNDATPFGSIFDHDSEPTELVTLESRGYALEHEISFLDRLHSWFAGRSDREYGSVSLLIHMFLSEGGWHVLSPGQGGKKMLGESTAGCGRSCQLSEVISLDVLQSFVPKLHLYLTEMEIEYWRLNSPRLDYLCLYQDVVVGVSVTRAWNGPSASFTSRHARKLLLKKLKGLELARKYAETPHQWQLQLLHVWSPSERTAILIKDVFEQVQTKVECSIPTLLLVSVTSFDIPAANSFLFRCD